MESKPLVSIITVCRNSQTYIRYAIESVLNQGYPYIEYIIVDGNSTDETIAVIQEYEPKFKGRMRWISEPDQGIYDAMNKGIKLAKGEIIGILNSDDWYSAIAVEKVVALFLSDTNIGLVHGRLANYNNQDKLDSVYGKRLSRFSFAEQTPFSHPTCFVRKTVYDSIGIFDVQFRTASDYDFMLRVYGSETIKTVYLDEVVTNFRKTGVTSSMRISPIVQIFRLLRKNKYRFSYIIIGIVYRLTRDIIKIALVSMKLEVVIKFRRRWSHLHEKV
ncbi:MAG: glycosyltransferase family 2 protein [Coleofasciculus sp. D1-CHI-01]|uniref:glycosyltransferase family 2 protein n=1 Tax=Coleofasciculus sp. D1-CHI-01 TaxID=3068482 RepID=UPI0033051A7F